MRHTVEIADTDGNTMQLYVTANNIGTGGSWVSLTKGMIRYHNGPVQQFGRPMTGMMAQLLRLGDGDCGIRLYDFTSWGTVNDQGDGLLYQNWVIGLTPGAIQWAVL